jgi:hypothetical protein
MLDEQWGRPKSRKRSHHGDRARKRQTTYRDDEVEDNDDEYGERDHRLSRRQHKPHVSKLRVAGGTALLALGTVVLKGAFW